MKYPFSFFACRYNLEFQVFDRYHTQLSIAANVTIVVKDLPHEAVVNHGSIRINGVSDEDFIRIWDYKVIYQMLIYVLS